MHTNLVNSQWNGKQRPHAREKTRTAAQRHLYNLDSGMNGGPSEILEQNSVLEINISSIISDLKKKKVTQFEHQDRMSFTQSTTTIQ